MNIIFTDIDGVLSTVNKTTWNKSSIILYNKLCLEFNLKPVVTSTWRVNHSKEQLQTIFSNNGITVPIYDYTPIFPSEGRGVEIEHWILENSPNSFVILDDNVRDIVSIGLPNIVKCRGWIGFSEDEYVLCKKLLKAK